MYLIQRENCNNFKIAYKIDINYKKVFLEVKKKCVKILCYNCKLNPQEIKINEPVKILHVSGYPEKGQLRHIAREIHPNTDYIVKEKNEETVREEIITSAAKSSGGINRRFDVWRHGEYFDGSSSDPIVDPSEIEITADVRNYAPAEDRFKTVDADGATITKPHSKRGVIYKVTYQYADFYDPQFSSTGF